MSPLFHKIGGTLSKYIKFEILQIVSPSEDVKFSNVRGLYLRKYGILFFGLLCESRANEADSKKHAIDGVFLLSIQVFRGVNDYCATSEK